MGNNGLIMQCFEENMPADGTLWKKLAADATKLKNLGVTAVWLPPAFKGVAGKNDTGYGLYDLYDLGEFNQKGSVSTKYGTKKDYIAAIKALQEKDIQVYADIPTGYRFGADGTELISADDFNAYSRNQMVGSKRVIKGWTKFDFPGRKGKYSKFTWNWKHFDGIDWDTDDFKAAIERFTGKKWKEYVAGDKDKYDYIMDADIDYTNQEVVDELYRWGAWFISETGVDGVKLSGVHRIACSFYRDWVSMMRDVSGKPLVSFGDCWHFDVDKLNEFLQNVNHEITLLDVPLHLRLFDASKAHGGYDLRTLADDTLVSMVPTEAVTFVDCHESQPGGIRESYVEEWFKPMAYAFIMLREQGYPSLFYGDYYGIPSSKVKSMKKVLDPILKARKLYAYGYQHDYFDDANCIGWTREGDEEHKGSGVAVVISDGAGGTKRMYVGRHHAGQFFSDITGNAKYNIKIDDDGCGEFYVNRGSAAVWVETPVKDTKPVKSKSTRAKKAK